jgi:hypothetical protein
LTLNAKPTLLYGWACNIPAACKVRRICLESVNRVAMQTKVTNTWKGAILAKRLAVILAVTILCALGDSSRHVTDAATPGEYQIKAAFLYNFAKFVEWPSGAFEDSSSPLVIGILGDDPFGSSLDQVTKGKTVDGRRITIKRFPRIREVESCQILFVCSSESSRLARAIESVKSAGVLTVSDIDRFAQRGGIVGFTMDDNKVGFEINVNSAQKANLKISSKLLKLARVVRD